MQSHLILRKNRPCNSDLGLFFFLYDNLWPNWIASYCKIYKWCMMQQLKGTEFLEFQVTGLLRQFDASVIIVCNAVAISWLLAFWPLLILARQMSTQNKQRNQKILLELASQRGNSEFIRSNNEAGWPLKFVWRYMCRLQSQTTSMDFLQSRHFHLVSI